MSKCWASPQRQWETSYAQREWDGLAGENLRPTHRWDKASQRIGTWVRFWKQAAIIRRKNGKKDFASEGEWMQIPLLSSDHDAFPSTSCTFSDGSQASLMGSPVHAHVHFHLDSPSWAMAPWVTLSPFQKAWAQFASSLFVHYNIEGIIIGLFSICWVFVEAVASSSSLAIFT